MAVPIFPNSSYFVALGESLDFFEQVGSAGQRHRARIYFCQSYAEFAEALKIMETPPGFLIDALDLDSEDLTQSCARLMTTGTPPVCYITDNETHPMSAAAHVRTVHLRRGASSDDWRTGLDHFMHSLTPKKLDQIMLHSIQTIMPQFFPNIGKFETIPYILPKADYQLNYSVSAGDVIGQCLVRAQWNEIPKLLSQNDTPAPRGKAMDILRESINQALGSVVQSILKLHPHLNMRIGLPTGFDLLKIPEIQSIRYFPSVHAADSQARLGISLGYVNLADEPIFDLSGFDASQTPDDVEFL